MTGRIISLDGCIGAGKTTLLKELKARGHCVFVEDVKGWYEILDLFYEDPKRWAFTLQVTVLGSLCEQYEAIQELCQTYKYVFMERSPETSFIFALNSKDLGYFTNAEFRSYEQLFKRFCWKPDIKFMLDVPMDVCYDRIHRLRKRPCEKNLSEGYLNALIKGHNNYTFDYHLDGQKATCELADEVFEILAQVK